MAEETTEPIPEGIHAEPESAGQEPSETSDPETDAVTDAGSPTDDVHKDPLVESAAFAEESGSGRPGAEAGLFGFRGAHWPGFVSGNLTPGTDRFLYGGEWFMPLFQNENALWYFDFRGQGDDNSAGEFNTGTGVRVLTETEWIFGTYGFWDRLNSSQGNSFDQAMIGVEAMNLLWDVRFNAYFPESAGKFVGAPTASVSDGNLVVRSGLERAYWGTDFEVGRLLWHSGPQYEHELRGFVGMYHFDHSAPSTPSITGPKVRLEYRRYDLSWFGAGSRLSFGLTAQTDDVRDDQLFAFARLRVPLDLWAHKREPLSPLHRRMLDRVVRDVDVVTGLARHTERAVDSLTDREILGVTRIDAGTEDGLGVINDLDEGALIVVDGHAGVIQSPVGIRLKPGQTLIGADSPLLVTASGSGRQAIFHPGGTRPVLDFGWIPPVSGTPNVFLDVAEPVAGLRMNDRTHLIGVDLRNVDLGISVRETDDVLIADVGVRDFHFAGVSVHNSTNVSMHDSQIRNALPDDPSIPRFLVYYPLGRGIVVSDSRHVGIRDSHVEATALEGIHVSRSENVEIRRTSIRDTKKDGIRLVETKNVSIEEAQLTDTGEVNPNLYSPGLLHHQLSGITLYKSEDTRIVNSRIDGSDGNGIYGYQTSGTQMHELAVTGVEHGVVFGDSQDVSVTDSNIEVPDEIISYPNSNPGQVAMVGILAPTHSGVVLRDVTGEVVVSGNDVRGGYAGSGVFFSGSDGVTHLEVRDNVIEKIGDSSGIDLASSAGHDLFAAVTGNTVQTPGSSFWLTARSNSAHNDVREVAITNNRFEGGFYTRLYGTTMDLDVVANHIGGNEMGLISVDLQSTLNLRYDENTSENGAEVMQFFKDGELFMNSLSGNDHEPQTAARF